MGTQESSSEGIPAGRDMEVDAGDGTVDDHAGEDSQPSERPQRGPSSATSQPEASALTSAAEPSAAEPSAAEPTTGESNAAEPNAAEPNASGINAAEPVEETHPTEGPAGPTGSEHTGSEHAGSEHTGSEHAGSRRSGADEPESGHAGSHRRSGQPIEAHFANPSRQKPQRYNRGRSKVHPTTPLDPITPYMAGPVPRRRKSDWPILVFALVVAVIVMATCCIAGFAIFRTYGLNL